MRPLFWGAYRGSVENFGIDGFVRGTYGGEVSEWVNEE